MIDDRRFFTWMDHGGSVNAPAEDNERQKQRATGRRYLDMDEYWAWKAAREGDNQLTQAAAE